MVNALQCIVPESIDFSLGEPISQQTNKMLRWPSISRTIRMRVCIVRVFGLVAIIVDCVGHCFATAFPLSVHKLAYVHLI